jgi:hypothetical protein
MILFLKYYAVLIQNLIYSRLIPLMISQADQDITGNNPEEIPEVVLQQLQAARSG